MFIKSLLMPVVTRRLLGRERLLAKREQAEHKRLSQGRRHTVHYFHQVDDPYSALMALILPALKERYAVDIVPHLVGPPADEAAPERERLIAYSRKDAMRLARHWRIPLSLEDRQPAADRVARISGDLLAAISEGVFVELAGSASQAFWSVSQPLPTLQWQGRSLTSAPAEVVAAHLGESGSLRQRFGHYLGATLYYEGEWYWGIDRLYHLEHRLQDLGAERAGVNGVLFPHAVDLDHPVTLAHPAPLDFFFSFRSPYSAIVAERVFSLAALTGTPIRARYVLPMVMRGLPVPRSKRMYIVKDAAREAYVRGIPFGGINDPVGRPAERGLALMPYAEREGKVREFVLSFMRAVWAEGVDAGSDNGLRSIVERAGLSWTQAHEALTDEGWRQTAEQNREAMFSLGLWGVPSFHVGDMAVWGQDRLWAVEEALTAS